MPKKTKCRQCGAEIVYDNISDHPFFPFCSKRCKLIDLGMWFEEEHKIEEPIEEAEAELDEPGEDEERQT